MASVTGFVAVRNPAAGYLVPCCDKDLDLIKGLREEWAHFSSQSEGMRSIVEGKAPVNQENNVTSHTTSALRKQQDLNKA